MLRPKLWFFLPCLPLLLLAVEALALPYALRQHFKAQDWPLPQSLVAVLGKGQVRLEDWGSFPRLDFYAGSHSVLELGQFKFDHNDVWHQVALGLPLGLGQLRQSWPGFLSWWDPPVSLSLQVQQAVMAGIYIQDLDLQVASTDHPQVYQLEAVADIYNQPCQLQAILQGDMIRSDHAHNFSFRFTSSGWQPEQLKDLFANLSLNYELLSGRLDFEIKGDCRSGQLQDAYLILHLKEATFQSWPGAIPDQDRYYLDRYIRRQGGSLSLSLDLSGHYLNPKVSTQSLRTAIMLDEGQDFLRNLGKE